MDMKHVMEVCRLSGGERRCRYLYQAGGYYCAKLTPMKEHYDMLVEDGLMIAQGDNCTGIPPRPIAPRQMAA